MTRDILHDGFRRILAREAGTGADGPAIAAAARRVCQRLVERLSPLIGDAGVAALCARSLHLAERKFPGLDSVRASAQGSSPFARLQSILQQQEPPAALEVAASVFVMANELLASFVGEDLATSLLRETWPEDFPRDTTEEAIA